MKKLLLLITLFITSFANSQELTLVELTSTGGTAFGDHAYHAVQGFDLSQFTYDGYDTSVTSYTFRNNILETPNEVYLSVGVFGDNTRDFIYGLGLVGRFFNADTEVPLTGIALNEYHIEDHYAGFSLSGAWYPVAGGSQYRFDSCDYVFSATYFPGLGFQVNATDSDLDPTSFQRIQARTYGGRGVYFQTSTAVVNAIDTFLTDFCLECASTDSTLQEKYALLNDGRGFSDYVEGVTNWIPSLGNNTIWTYQPVNGNGLFDQIIERDGNFILYKSVAGDAGGLPAATGTYSCLADLVAAL